MKLEYNGYLIGMSKKDVNMIDEEMEKTTPKKEKKKKITTESANAAARKVLKVDDSKHIIKGVCQLCGANIGKGRPHLARCKLA